MDRVTTATAWLLGNISHREASSAFSWVETSERLDECCLAELGEDAFLEARTLGEREHQERMRAKARRLLGVT